MEPSPLPRDISFSESVYSIENTSDEDVFVAGYPKSGNTLLQHCIAHLIHGLNESAGRTLVHLTVPDVHANSHYFRLQDRCFFKTHDLPKKHHRNVIYIVRDGREAMLSYYHMLRNMGHDVSHSDVYLGQLEVFGGQWHTHVASWESNPFNANLLWLRYEDMKFDKPNQLRRICEFLELERSKQEIAEVARLTSFEHMQQVERRSDWVRQNMVVFKKPGGFVRRGAIDSYREEVAPELVSAFESRSASVLQRHYPDSNSGSLLKKAG
ncbi:sulfotransferase domain-containing protein [Stieleria sp. JC731]|uniref:sulfotransferase domain-containing protein n=1 Tax=Pirellulaceae TaxID=2691357 RepID=UPI001E6050B6|nr:sulfotransferase domain-containing protein [Stieleria sp. JC731]MCC9599899.1 sulfotransferase domain-containing protein [Stieleria sp. JC731]